MPKFLDVALLAAELCNRVKLAQTAHAIQLTDSTPTTTAPLRLLSVTRDNSMKRIHILGRKNHGKTTLMVELVEHLTARGLRVGTIKHTHHAHELDTPGKDSHRHRAAGASVSAILSRSMNAVFWPPQNLDGSGAPAAPADRYAEFAPHFAGCDLVLVEGDTTCPGIKIEVWRQAVGSEPMAPNDPQIRAVVTDDTIDLPVPRVPRSDVNAVAEKVLELLELAAVDGAH
jgi:molybdopterin-guanine dinucleotide biosynthesis adapter protein